jgi:hypothetical protein
MYNFGGPAAVLYTNLSLSFRITKEIKFPSNKILMFI